MREIRRLDEGDLEALIALRDSSYPGASPELLRQVLPQRLPYSTGLFIGGELACSYVNYHDKAYFDGRLVEVGLLAGVATALQYRRGGLVRELLVRELTGMREAGIAWSLEYPFDPAFYARMGWQSVPNGCELELPVQRLHGGRPPEARRLELTEFPRMAAIFERFAPNFTLALARRGDPRDTWRRIATPPWLDGTGLLYEVEDGYVLLSVERANHRLVVTVEDHAYSSPAGRQRIMDLLGAYQGQAEVVCIHVPPNDPLALDYGTKHFKPGRAPLQARIVDVGAVLETMRPVREGTATLRVHDPLLGWNDGTFAVRAEGREIRAERATGGRQPRAETTINGLALLALGVVTPAEAIALGHAEGDAEALALIASGAPSQPLFQPQADGF